MNAVTLTSVFLKSEEQLKQSLQGLRLPKDYVELQKAVNSHIESLLVKENDFRNSLNASDAEMLTHALRMALSFQKLSLTESIDFKTLSIRKDYKVNQSTNDNTDIIESVLSLLPTVICAFINPWLAVAVGAGTVGAKKIYRQKNGRKYVVQEIKKDVSRDISQKEIETILAGIESLCKEIDEIISKIQRDRKDLLDQMQIKQEGYTLENMYPQLLASLQYLFMENLKNEPKNQYVQNMLFCLQGYGYELVEYSLPTSGFFTKKMNPNVSEETMYLPAIVKGVNGTKIVVAQGIVYIPAN
jgi:hypothetical protein